MLPKIKQKLLKTIFNSSGYYDIQAERHVSALIATIGSQGYKLQVIFAPGDPCTKTFEEQCEALEQLLVYAN